MQKAKEEVQEKAAAQLQCHTSSQFFSAKIDERSAFTFLRIRMAFSIVSDLSIELTVSCQVDRDATAFANELASIGQPEGLDAGVQTLQAQPVLDSRLSYEWHSDAFQGRRFEWLGMQPSRRWSRVMP